MPNGSKRLLTLEGFDNCLGVSVNNNVRETPIRGKGDGSDSSYCFRITLEYFLVDIVALRTGLGPVVIIDYRGKMPEMQERLFALVLLSTLC
ncbi:hypothetical protein ACB092_04G042700 [Castanea dentata]